MNSVNQFALVATLILAFASGDALAKSKSSGSKTKSTNKTIVVQAVTEKTKKATRKTKDVMERVGNFVIDNNGIAKAAAKAAVAKNPANRVAIGALIVTKAVDGYADFGGNLGDMMNSVESDAASQVSTAPKQ